MANQKFTVEQMEIYTKQVINGCNELLSLLKEKELDSISLDCQLKSIERDVESLRFRLDDFDE